MPRRVAIAITCLLIALACSACGRGGGSGRGATAAPPETVTTTTTAEAPTPAPPGYPELATKNTTRVAGADPAADAAGIALAVFPATSDETRPDAVALVDARDWRNGVAAAVLAAPPVHAAILLSDGPRLPPASAAALRALRPKGSAAAGGARVIRVGDVARPAGLKSTKVTARDPIALARELDAFQSAAAGDPSASVVVAPADDEALAMPAAGWAAKSGDTVLYAHRDSVPAPTRAALRAHDRPAVYVLGPPSAVGEKAVRELRRLGASIKRIGAGDPAANSVAFARYVDPSFGWGVVDPGHGLVFARTDRPLDAAAAAPLSANGSYGPLLVVGSADRLDNALTEYLLDIQPGYRRDPVRGVYNHGWIVGDDRAISVGTQSRIDDLLEIRRLRTAK